MVCLEEKIASLGRIEQYTRYYRNKIASVASTKFTVLHNRKLDISVESRLFTCKQNSVCGLLPDLHKYIQQVGQ